MRHLLGSADVSADLDFPLLTMEDSGAIETVVRPEFVCSLMQSRVLDRFDGTNMQGFITKMLWLLIILLFAG